MEPAAAAHAPAFLAELAALLVASAGIAYVCHRFGIMPIVSFLVTGAVLGPHALGFVHDETLIESAAEIGVILLLFTIGIEFSLEKLARIKRLIFIGGGLQVVLVLLLVTGALALFGVDWRSGIFTGCLVALSSTAIVMKLLMAGGDMGSEEGQAALGILIFQDLAVVAMVLLVPMLGGMGGSAADVFLALGKAAAIVTLVLVAARRVMPPLLEAVARTCSQEIFLLTVVAICLGTAYLTSLAGVSLSLGAFLAGLIVSESRFSHLAFGEILPLQILFSAMFFVSVGLLLNVGFLLTNPLPILGVIVLVLIVKALSAGVGLLAMGYRVAPAMGSAVMLAQVGEFSFVLERTGREAGLFPAGVQDGGPETFIAATVALMMATPLMYRLGGKMRRQAVRPTSDSSAEQSDEADDQITELTNHVIVAGYGMAGMQVAKSLDDRGEPYIVVTLSPDGAREAEDRGLRVLRGNYTRQHELRLAGVRSARMLVVADDDLETTRQVVAAASSLNPEIEILARTDRTSNVTELQDSGARDVVADEQEGLIRVVSHVLAGSGADDIEIHQREQRARLSISTATRRSTATGIQVDGETSAESIVVSLSEAQRGSSACGHVGDTQDVRPGSDGCEECLKLGWRWVHLRICMTCGQVGCCDSSRGRHATKHYHARSHPIVRSLERGEDWAWCYDDQVFL